MKWLLAALVIGSVVFLAVNFAKSPSPTSTSSRADGQIDEIEYYGRGINTLSYGSTGQMTQQLSAASTEHNVETGDTFFYDATMVAVNADASRWTIQSKVAHLNQGQKLTLSQNVDIYATPTPSTSDTKQQPNLRIQTERLVYQHQQQTAKTEQAIVIEGEGIRLLSEGLEIDLAQQTLLLKRKVVSYYHLN